VSHKLRVVKNGIKPFNLLPCASTNFTVGTLAELHKIKGLDILLKAWAEFIKTGATAKLVIMGGGEELENLKLQARSYKLEASVEFKGFVENARAHLKDFDIFVLPSRSENLPYAVLEAGLAGLSVVATSVGGIPEIIENGKEGLLVTPENVDDLAEAIETLYKDSELRKTLGENLKKKVSSEFSIEKMVEETLSLYK